MKKNKYRDYRVLEVYLRELLSENIPCKQFRTTIGYHELCSYNNLLAFVNKRILHNIAENWLYGKKYKYSTGTIAYIHRKKRIEDIKKYRNSQIPG